MITKKTIRYKTKFSFLDNFQYILSAIITICFAIGLIPGFYVKISNILIITLVIQILISIVRLKLINVILELIILLLSIISLIPYLGWIFRLIAFIASLLDLATFKNQTIYKQIEIRTFRKRDFSFKSKKKSLKKTNKNKNIQDAEFKEK